MKNFTALLVLFFAIVCSACSASDRPSTTESKNNGLSQSEASEVLKLVITDWMTSSKEKAFAYLIDPEDTTGQGKRPKLKRLLIDKKNLPTQFDLKISNIPIELIDRSTRMPESGELCISIHRYERKTDGSIEVEFLHGGYGILGGANVAYLARKHNGKWSVKLTSAFDP